MTLAEFHGALIAINTVQPCKTLKGNDGRHAWQIEKSTLIDYQTGVLHLEESLRCSYCHIVLMWPEGDVSTPEQRRFGGKGAVPIVIEEATDDR